MKRATFLLRNLLWRIGVFCLHHGSKGMKFKIQDKTISKPISISQIPPEVVMRMGAAVHSIGDISKITRWEYGPRCECGTGNGGLYEGYGAHHHVNHSSTIAGCDPNRPHDENGWVSEK